MSEILYRLPDGTTRRVPAAEGATVMSAAVAVGVPGIDGDCGGSLTCASCHVVVLEPAHLRTDDLSEDEREMLDCLDDTVDGSRLGCQVRLGPDHIRLVVEVPA
jgi:2Fe-2S ferredoxin